ncbi:MAG: hypothetical protein H6738_06850 [Alphaproteobacteria bacterium]|nr:hypothetical protein [Alphaproteobacteria bacterium]MCB9696480.1 hypothetical protein [Alphaproteobacteria bacterium]
MSCRDARRLLLEEGSDAVRAHLETCADCRRLATAIDEVDGRVRRMVDAYEERPLEAALNQAREAGRPRRWGMTVHGGLIGLAAAAALMVAVAGTRHAEQAEPEPQVAAATSEVGDLVRATAQIPWGGLSEQDWALRANELVRLEPSVPTTDTALRFELYAQIGRAAENANMPAPPFYGQVEAEGTSRVVNVYWWKASELAMAEPALLERLTPELATSVRSYVLARTGDDAPAPRPATASAQAEVDRVEKIPWNALSEQDWALTAYQLLQTVPTVPDTDHALRFRLFAQIGRAAENANVPAPPFYDQIEVGGERTTVNLYWWKASEFALQHPELYRQLDDDLAADIRFYADKR